jgi:hypothetical protein
MRRFFLGLSLRARYAQRLFRQYEFELNYGAEMMRSARAAHTWKKPNRRPLRS